MHRLTLIVLASILLAFSAGSHSGIISGALRAGAATAKIERQAANAMKLEGMHAAGKAGVGAERAAQALSAERSAAGIESKVARAAREAELPRAKDGRLALDGGRLSARLFQDRVGAAMMQTHMDVVRAVDNRIVRLSQVQGPDFAASPWVFVADVRKPAGPIAIPNVQLVRAAHQAIADTVGTAFRAAVLELRDRLGPNRRASPAEVRAETLELVRILQDDGVLTAAKNVSMAVAAGRGGASLHDVAEVALHRQKGQPTTLWVRLTATQARPIQGVWVRMYLDQVLGLIRMDGL